MAPVVSPAGAHASTTKNPSPKASHTTVNVTRVTGPGLKAPQPLPPVAEIAKRSQKAQHKHHHHQQQRYRAVLKPQAQQDFVLQGLVVRAPPKGWRAISRSGRPSSGPKGFTSPKHDDRVQAVPSAFRGSATAVGPAAVPCGATAFKQDGQGVQVHVAATTAKPQPPATAVATAVATAAFKHASGTTAKPQPPATAVATAAASTVVVAAVRPPSRTRDKALCHATANAQCAYAVRGASRKAVHQRSTSCDVSTAAALDGSGAKAVGGGSAQNFVLQGLVVPGFRTRRHKQEHNADTTSSNSSRKQSPCVLQNQPVRQQQRHMALPGGRQSLGLPAPPAAAALPGPVRPVSAPAPKFRAGGSATQDFVLQGLVVPASVRRQAFSSSYNHPQQQQQQEQVRKQNPVSAFSSLSVASPLALMASADDFDGLDDFDTDISNDLKSHDSRDQIGRCVWDDQPSADVATAGPAVASSSAAAAAAGEVSSGAALSATAVTGGGDGSTLGTRRNSTASSSRGSSSSSSSSKSGGGMWLSRARGRQAAREALIDEQNGWGLSRSSSSGYNTWQSRAMGREAAREALRHEQEGWQLSRGSSNGGGSSYDVWQNRARGREAAREAGAGAYEPMSSAEATRTEPLQTNRHQQQQQQQPSHRGNSYAEGLGQDWHAEGQRSTSRTAGPSTGQQQQQHHGNYDGHGRNIISSRSGRRLDLAVVEQLLLQLEPRQLHSLSKLCKHQLHKVNRFGGLLIEQVNKLMSYFDRDQQQQQPSHSRRRHHHHQYDLRHYHQQFLENVLGSAGAKLFWEGHDRVWDVLPDVRRHVLPWDIALKQPREWVWDFQGRFKLMCGALERLELLQKVYRRKCRHGSSSSSSCGKSGEGGRRGKAHQKTSTASAAGCGGSCRVFGKEMAQQFVDALEQAWFLKRQMVEHWPLTGVAGLQGMHFPRELVSGMYRGLGGWLKGDFKQLKGLVEFLAHMYEQAAVDAPGFRG